MIYTGPEPLPDNVMPSLTAMFLSRVEKSPDKEAFRYPDADDNWVSVTWQEAGNQAELWAAGLTALGARPGARVGIAAGTSYSWTVAALAIGLAGCAFTTVYPQTDAKDVGYELGDCAARILFAADVSQLDKVMQVRDQLPDLTHVVLFEGEGDGDFAISLDRLVQLGQEALAKDANVVKDRAAAIGPDDLATMIYTSGTTGQPKGVQLPHSVWGYTGAVLNGLDVLRPDDVEYRWLPMAHVFAATLLAAQLSGGYTCAIDGRPSKILENLSVIKPTFMGAVPRIFEKMYAAITAMAKAAGDEQQAAFTRGVAVAEKFAELTVEGAEIPSDVAAGQAQADAAIFANVRAAMGGNIRFFISGSAALAPAIARFFQAAGMPVLEGYGLTETASIGSICRPTSLKVGTVGQPLPGTEMKLAADGEILMRGPSVMSGYLNLPDATKDVREPDGWFHTGDIGVFDEQGRLRLTDRKKDLYKTSNGKYVAPSPIESQFKADCGLVGYMMIEANNRKFVSAIISLDPEACAAWAQTKGKPTDIATLSHDPDLLAEIQDAIDVLNTHLNHWEQVRKFIVLDHELTVQGGELTPSLKLRRGVVEEANLAAIDALYA